jgi:hypothetical protein
MFSFSIVFEPWETERDNWYLAGAKYLPSLSLLVCHQPLEGNQEGKSKQGELQLLEE